MTCWRETISFLKLMHIDVGCPYTGNSVIYICEIYSTEHTFPQNTALGLCKFQQPGSMSSRVIFGVTALFSCRENTEKVTKMIEFLQPFDSIEYRFLFSFYFSITTRFCDGVATSQLFYT